MNAVMDTAKNRAQSEVSIFEKYIVVRTAFGIHHGR